MKCPFWAALLLGTTHTVRWYTTQMTWDTCHVASNSHATANFSEGDNDQFPLQDQTGIALASVWFAISNATKREKTRGHQTTCGATPDDKWDWPELERNFSGLKCEYLHLSPIQLMTCSLVCTRKLDPLRCETYVTCHFLTRFPLVFPLVFFHS